MHLPDGRLPAFHPTMGAGRPSACGGAFPRALLVSFFLFFFLLAQAGERAGRRRCGGRVTGRVTGDRACSCPRAPGGCRDAVCWAQPPRAGGVGAPP